MPQSEFYNLLPTLSMPPWFYLKSDVPDMDLVSPMLAPDLVLVSPMLAPDLDLVSLTLVPDPDLVSSMLVPDPDLVSPMLAPDIVLVSPMLAPNLDLVSLTLAPDLVSSMLAPDIDMVSPMLVPDIVLVSSMLAPDIDMENDVHVISPDNTINAFPTLAPDPAMENDVKVIWSEHIPINCEYAEKIEERYKANCHSAKRSRKEDANKANCDSAKRSRNEEKRREANRASAKRSRENWQKNLENLEMRCKRQMNEIEDMYKQLIVANPKGCLHASLQVLLSSMMTDANEGKDAIACEQTDAKQERRVPIRKQPLGFDLDKVDERMRRQLLKNRASAKRSRQKKQNKFEEFSMLCKRQEQLIQHLNEQLKGVVQIVDVSEWLKTLN